jgi:hypothetical protein
MIDINKTNNYLSSHTIMHIKKTVKYDVGNAYPGMGQGRKEERLANR